MIFTNQLRQKIGVMFGNPETTTGGMALKFYASVRLDVRRIESLKHRGSVIGNPHPGDGQEEQGSAALPPGRIRHHVQRGYLPLGDVLDLAAVEHEIVTKAPARSIPSATPAWVRAVRTPDLPAREPGLVYSHRKSDSGGLEPPAACRACCCHRLTAFVGHISRTHFCFIPGKLIVSSRLPQGS